MGVRGYAILRGIGAVFGRYGRLFAFKIFPGNLQGNFLAVKNAPAFCKGTFQV